ncbi:MAG TPA: hypothetical protein VJQ45_11075, partial [Ktedonobacterales bacterium]|nr:hypothetical protein [Ktedonobacterales bacterium]
MTSTRRSAADVPAQVPVRVGFSDPRRLLDTAASIKSPESAAEPDPNAARWYALLLRSLPLRAPAS